MILALAGRRVDDPNADVARFPAATVERVHREVAALLQEKSISTLVGSAACGADLIALVEAGRLNLRRRVILPFGREEFRAKSVTDRAGDWGELYDVVLDEVSARGDVVIMQVPSDADPYAAASNVILDEAMRLGRESGEAVSAALVWDGAERGQPDYTADFGKEARRRGLDVFEVNTLWE